MPRIPREMHEERLAETENALVRLRASYRVVQHLTKKFGVAPGTVHKWIRRVKERWGTEADIEDRVSRRNEMRVTLNEILSAAMTRTIVVKNDDGTVVLDPKSKMPVLKSNPDLQRSLHAAAQLRALDGLDAPSKVAVEGALAVTSAVELDGHIANLTREQRAALRTLTGTATTADAAPPDEADAEGLDG